MQIAMLGPLAVADDTGAPVRLAGPRLRRLLILLALDAGRVVDNSRLVAGLWAGEPPTGAANALQALVSRLRRALPDLRVESHAAGYRLVVPAEAVDLVRFERLAAAGRTLLPGDPDRAASLLTEALDLWRGPALADLDGTRVPYGLVARLEEARLAATENLVEARLMLGASDEMVPELRAMVAANPARERPAGQLMRALHAAGRPAEALAAFDRLRTTLADTLGADPSAELSALHLQLLRAPDKPLGAGAPGAGTVGRSVNGGRRGAEVTGGGPPPRTNLPAALTSFVGREDECRRVAGLVSTSRLTTLTGPGGAGKTRLAVESTRALVDRTLDGVWLIELAPVTDSAEVPHAVLATLGLREQAILAGGRSRVPPAEPVDPVSRLVAAIGARRLLLVLDNCEHLLDAAAALAGRLLAGCPELRVLATSREPLGITGEALCPVDSLALPPAEITSDQALGYASVRLFADRASAVRPDFAVSPDTAADVVRICRALDGMPLAIELAAARLRALTVGQVAARLDDRFRLLTGGSRTALPRHQTLRAVVDWSWDLLDDTERALLRRLSVFAGGAQLNAIERVCAGPELAVDEVFDRLAALVDKSLVVAAGSTEPRYRLLETIREYGLQRLADAGEADRIRRSHAAQFLALAEAADARLRGPAQLHWLARLAAEHDNLMGALRWTITTGDVVTAVRYIASLGWYWWLRGHRVEGAEYADQVLGRPDAKRAPEPVYALAYASTTLLVIAGGQGGDLEKGRQWMATAARLAEPHRDRHPLLRLIGPMAASFESWFAEPAIDRLCELFDDPDVWVAASARMFHALCELNLGRPDVGAEANLRTALAGYRSLNERWGMAFTLGALADLLSRRGDHPGAADCHEQALVEVRVLGMAEDVPEMRLRLAHELWHLGQRERALALLAEAAREAERIGSDESRAAVAYEYGEILRAQGDWAAARARLEQTLRLIGGMNVAPQWMAMINSSLGAVDAAQGNFPAARKAHDRALKLACHSHDAPVIGVVLVGFADLAAHTGQMGAAAVLLGAAAGVRGAPDRSLLDGARVEKAARAALGDAGFAEAYARGRTTTAATAPALVRVTLAG